MLLHTFWREKALRDRRKVVLLTAVVNRAFRIALVDPGYRQRSAEVHGGSRRRSLERFHLRDRSLSRREARKEGNGIEKCPRAPLVVREKRARGHACVRAYV